MAPAKAKAATRPPQQQQRAAKKPGAKKRAIVSLVGKKFAESLDPAALFAFWSARTFLAPPLRTSFGEYTLVNSVDRRTLTTTPNQDFWMWIPWTNSPLACLTGSGTTDTALYQRVYGTLAGAPPQYIRPLRMSFQISCIGSALNASGSIRVLSFDNPLIVSATLPAASSDAVSTVPPTGAFTALVNDALDSVEYTAQTLFEEREFVACPCSYPAYNTYYPFVTMLNTSDGGTLNGRDFLALINGVNGNYTAGVTSSGSVTGALGGLPPLRGFLVTIPASDVAQTYRVAIRRQDGCRYAVNTLGATFSMVHPKANSRGEDMLIHSVSQVSTTPAQSMTTAALSSMADAVGTITRDMTEAAKIVGAGLENGRTVFAHAQDAALMAKNFSALVH